MPKVSSGLSSFRLKTVGWAGGANIRDAPNFVAPDQMRRNENITLSERGGGRKRLGCESHGTFGAGTDRILSIYTFYRAASGNPPQVIIHTSGGQLLYTAAPTAEPVVWTPIASGLSTTAPFSFATFGGKVYMSNGVNNYCAWDGTTFTTFPSAPKGKYLCVWVDTMWVAGVTNLDDRVYSSDAGLPEIFTVSSYIDINKGDGDMMRALTTDGQFLIVGKRDSTYTIYDPVTFANRVVDFEKGFESHFAVAHYESNLYFLTRRGIGRYIGDAPSEVISERLDPLFTPELVALNQLQYATSYVYQDRIGFAIPELGQTKNTIVIEYYPRIAVSQFGSQGVAPFVFHRMPVQNFTRWRWGSEDQLFGGHNNANKFLCVFAPVGTDDGVAFTGLMHTPFFDLGDAITTKYLRECRFLCFGRFNVMVYRNYDFSTYSTIVVDGHIDDADLWDKDTDVWGEGVWAFESFIRDLRRNVDLYGRCFSFSFQDSESGTTPQLVYVGAQGKQVVAGEWAIYGMTSEGVILGKRT
jgi:hypothetical protein